MKFEAGVIYFNKITVLQSLNDNDLNTGTELYDDIISRRSWLDPNLTTEILNIENKSHLMSKLNDLIDECKVKSSIPFIHFETHGFENGITLKSGEDVYWNEIIPKLKEINILTENNLFISVSSCFGGHIQFHLKITEPCPFRGFIGPMKIINSKDLLTAFTPFFNVLLKSNDFEEAINALNLSNISGIPFHHTNSEAFFDIVYHTNEEKNREERIDFVAKDGWNNNPKAKLLYKNFDEFRQFIESTNEDISPESYQILRKRFLHL